VLIVLGRLNTWQNSAMHRQLRNRQICFSGVPVDPESQEILLMVRENDVYRLSCMSVVSFSSKNETTTFSTCYNKMLMERSRVGEEELTKST